MDEKRLAAIEARAEAATEDPWFIELWSSGSAVNGPDIVADDGAVPCFARDEDAEFIAASRTDIPALVAAVRAERDRADAAEAKLDDIRTKMIELDWAAARLAALGSPAGTETTG